VHNKKVSYRKQSARQQLCLPKIMPRAAGMVTL